MATNLHSDSGQGLGELVSGIIHDAQELLNQQLTLFKHEVRQDINNVREALGILALASGVLLVAAVLLGLMLVHLVAWLIPSWPMWGDYALVGGVLLALGLALAWMAREKLRPSNVLPEQSAKALEESLEWKTKPT
jgi:uncharacterized membrane protein YqjE